jgi:hypothetical protein
MASKIPKDYTYNGLTYKEWVEEGRALVVKQGNLTGWSNKYWVRPDGTQVELYSQKRPSTPQSVLEKGGHYGARKTSVRENFQKTRKVNEGAWREALRKSVQKMGLGDRYEEFVKEIETGLRQWKKDIAAWNRKLPGGADDPLAVTRGHIKALANGGMDLPENIIREFKYAVDGVRGNLSRIASEDSPLIARMMAGAPDNTDEWVIKRMLAESEGGDITRNQSHELREAILAAGDDTELIDDLIAKADIETRPIKPKINVGDTLSNTLSIRNLKNVAASAIPDPITDGLFSVALPALALASKGEMEEIPWVVGRNLAEDAGWAAGLNLAARTPWGQTAIRAATPFVEPVVSTLLANPIAAAGGLIAADIAFGQGAGAGSAPFGSGTPYKDRDEWLYKMGGGQAKQKENRLTAEQVRVIGRKNLELQHLENMKIE